MSRCPRTDAILEAAFADAGPTAAHAQHVTICAECARALALARRFDGELHQVGSELAAPDVSDAGAWNQARGARSEGGDDMQPTPGLFARAVIVVAVATVAFVALSNVPLGLQPVGRIGDDELARWLDDARIATHEELDVGGQTEVDEWEAAQVEICGGTVLAFFQHAERPGIAYRWAAGRPGDWLDRSIATGRGRTLAEPEVAALRAALPLCTMVVAPDAPVALEGELDIGPQEVVRVPDLRWIGDPDHAPIEVEGRVDAPRQDVLLQEFGVFGEGYFVGRIDDPSIRAIELVAVAGRYRYTVAAPALVIGADLGDGRIGYQLLDATGSVVAAGWVRDLGGPEEEARRARAEAVAAAEAARRAMEGQEIGASCDEWAAMTADEQLSRTELAVADLLERVRARHHLPPDASRAEILAGARASLDEGCDQSPPDRQLQDIVDELYGDG